MEILKIPKQTMTVLLGWFFVLVVSLTFVCGDSVMNIVTLAALEQPCEVTSQYGTHYQACATRSTKLLSGLHYNISVNPPSMTCGDPPQPYCTLETRQFDVCNASDPERMHPAKFMADHESPDSSPTWWQSVSWTQYPTPLDIMITLNFGKQYILTSDIEIVFQSSRPNQMALEKSVDNGKTWTPLQFYAEDCNPYIVKGYDKFPTVNDPDRVYCTTQYSDVLPLINGVVRFPLFQDRLNLFMNSSRSRIEMLYNAYGNEKLRNFLTITDLRIHLIHPATDGHEITEELADLIGYYYAISNIRLGGMCYCNLHGNECIWKADGSAACTCEHNTGGRSCEKCKPLYNDRPYQPGGFLPYPGGFANECVKCECNDHADSCTYNPFLRSGVCDNCQHNTTGAHCDICHNGFYRNVSLPLEDPHVCISCDCDPWGVEDGDLSCVPDILSGELRCNCKAGVIGNKCDRCPEYHWGLRHPSNSPGICKVCGCHLDGTIDRRGDCDLETGQCPCRQGNIGRDCSTCADGLYGFPECSECQCDAGGSMSPVCSKDTGLCTCRQNIASKRCDQVADNNFLPTLDSVSYYASSGSCKVKMDADTTHVFAICKKGQSIKFQITEDVFTAAGPWSYIPALRYSLETSYPTSVEVTFSQSSKDMSQSCPQNYGFSVIYQLSSLSPGLNELRMNNSALTFHPGCEFSATLQVTVSNSPITVHQLYLIPDTTKTSIYRTAGDSLRQQYLSCVEQLLIPGSRENVLRIDDCSQFFFTAAAEIYDGARECNCNAIGSVPNSECEKLGGQCVCQPGVTGRACDRCQQGYNNLTSDGCKVISTGLNLAVWETEWITLTMSVATCIVFLLGMLGVMLGIYACPRIRKARRGYRKFSYLDFVASLPKNISHVDVGFQNLRKSDRPRNEQHAHYM